jgi:hypothetical protein
MVRGYERLIELVYARKMAAAPAVVAQRRLSVVR